MEKKELVLQVGDYAGSSFDDVVNIVISHNRSMGKAHLVAKRNRQLLTLICSQRTACAFRVNVRLLPSVGGVRITKFSGHSCVGGSSRKRQFKTEILARRAPVLTEFMDTKGRVSGNAAELTEMVRKQCGVVLKPSQAHSIVASKLDTEVNHLAQIRVLRSYLAAVQQRDPGGVYKLTTTPLSGTTRQQLHSVFCCPKGVMDTWAAFNGFVSVGAAHLISVMQGQLFTLTTYDANRQATTLAFGMAQGESALSWTSFLSSCISCFPNIMVVTSDGAKGLDSAEVSDLLSSHNITRTRGVVSSTSAEQTNSTLVKMRAEPICNLVASVIGRMSDDRFRRGRMANQMMTEGKFLTPYCFKKHQEKVIQAEKLLVEPEAIESGTLSCVVRSEVTLFDVTVSSDYHATCSCRHFEEHQRPCSHVVAALLYASRRLVQHRVAFDPWNKHWFGDVWLLKTWAKQHEGSIKRVAVTGDQLKQDDLVPFDLVAKPGRKRKKSYSPSKTRARLCSSCGQTGHFSQTCGRPNIHNLVEAKRKHIDKAAQSMIIDLTACDDGDATCDDKLKHRV